MERHTKVIIALMFVAWFLITASTVIHQEIHSEMREHLQHSLHKQEHRLSDAFQELRREEHVLEEKFEEAREFVENKLEDTAGQAVLALAELEWEVDARVVDTSAKDLAAEAARGAARPGVAGAEPFVAAAKPVVAREPFVADPRRPSPTKKASLRGATKLPKDYAALAARNVLASAPRLRRAVHW